jgi:hypothetical protein
MTMLAFLPCFLGSIILPFVVTLFIYFLVRGSLRGLLNEVIGIPAATIFYTRVLLIGLLFIGLATVLESNVEYKEGQAFMEYVWTAASKLSSLLVGTCVFLGVYLVLVTILAASLRRRNDQ